jgi:membrane associated rhomboid family serine protease
MFGNIAPVTKNLVLLNIVLFILTFFLQQKGIMLDNLLAAHYIGTPLFQPYQIATYFFMHGGFFHIFMNMFILITFGSFLERLWGAKRYFMLYVASALGAYLLYSGVGFFQLIEIKKAIGDQHIIAGINGLLKEYGRTDEALAQINHFMYNKQVSGIQIQAIQAYLDKSLSGMVGASGAIFGIMAAFAILFPNTELMLLFPPIPIKAKYLIGGYFAFEVYNSFQNTVGDNIAHLAHVGGAIVGAVIVLIWRKKGQNFY